MGVLISLDPEIRPYFKLCLILVQTIYKYYLQKTLAGMDLKGSSYLEVFCALKKLASPHLGS